MVVTVGTERKRDTEPRRPAVVHGEVLAERYFPRSPLDPDRDGVYPTVTPGPGSVQLSGRRRRR